MKIKEKWKCPRCHRKMYLSEEKCSNCGLIRARLANATNTAAIKAIKKKEYNKIVYYNQLPKDIVKWKLLLYTIFLGWFGVHYAKVGRFKMFIYMATSMTLFSIFGLLVVTKIFPISYVEHVYWGFLAWAMIFPACFALMIWVVSIFQVIFNRFKVPIAIDEDYVIDGLDKEIAKDIISEVKKEEMQENTTLLGSGTKKTKIRLICASCGQFVKVNEDETICPKCGENLKG